MTKEKEILEVSEKDQFGYAESVKYLVEQKRAEFQALQGKINQYKTQLATLEQRLITLESEHKAKLLLDRQKFEGEKQNTLNDLNNRSEALRKARQILCIEKWRLRKESYGQRISM